MSAPLRPSSSRWRRAASLVLAAGWARPGPTTQSLPPLPDEGFRLLLLQRSQGQGFMPGAHVFPGGVLDAADRSADWLRLFAPHHLPPRFGLSPKSAPRTAFPVLPGYGSDADAEALPDDVAFRICAIREAFEEAGLLLLRPRGSTPDSGHGSGLRSEPGCALAPPPGMADWRARVHSDPRHFLSLCAHLDCTPDIWALHDWSTWLTPFIRPGGRRFDTAFFLCCLREPPATCPDETEVVSCQWSSPSEATQSFISKEIWLAPPQFYEIRRLENFASLSDLYQFCLDRGLEGRERWLPISLLAADGALQLLPGDELYLEDSDYLEKPLSTEKKIEEIMKEGKTFHRVVLHDRHLYSVHVTVQPKSKHVYPKTYVVGKSRM
ncbi:PREDICTED: nucleoside diphosphate-linked moiety X motif 19, mitochondrial [Chrysochloris asiatica]|uniref:Acyl-coenzyme A diphosphatase NUDT19 n=1 Tax=Chrysochloris asiatica TaxID=185453 RepID=A0A9B0TUU1_CHRAS|nr:PREDICTED: nucleoside diphosphate-linked moiety X motif 19, mitochondrial [Chrysochloris asiatica]